MSLENSLKTGPRDVRATSSAHQFPLSDLTGVLDPCPQLDDSPTTSLQGSSTLPPSTVPFSADKTTLVPPRYGSLRCEHPLLPSTRGTGQTLQDKMGGDGYTHWLLLQIQTGRQQSRSGLPTMQQWGKRHSGEHWVAEASLAKLPPGSSA